MSNTIGNIVNLLSGGTGNIDPLLSIGGGVSSKAVGSQSIAAPTLCTGVTIKFAHNNPEGAGTLKYTLSTNSVSWRPPSSATDYATVISTDGEYMVGSPVEGFMVVNVVVSELPAGSRSEVLGVSPAIGSVWDTVQPSESLAGKTEYRCTYIKNTGDSIMYNVKLWIFSQTAGQDSVAIALDPAGKGNGTTTGVAIQLVDEIDSTNMLSSVVFSTPASVGESLLLGDIAPDEVYAFWEKRIVPTNSSQQTLNNNYYLSIATDL